MIYQSFDSYRAGIEIPIDSVGDKTGQRFDGGVVGVVALLRERSCDGVCGSDDSMTEAIRVLMKGALLPTDLVFPFYSVIHSYSWSSEVTAEIKDR